VTGPDEPGALVRPAQLIRSWTDPNGVCRPLLAWSAPPRWRAVSSAVVGGGIGSCGWWLNAQVDLDYSHPDPACHARELASGLGLGGDGVAMLTAADVEGFRYAADGGVEVVATVGLGLPVPAAASQEAQRQEAGTINILVLVPAMLGDAALVNLVITATEAKTQALVEAGVPGTGTSSDAVCIAAQSFPSDARTTTARPAGDPGAEPDLAYGGPRSLWGSRAARAVHQAVAAGTADWIHRHPPGDRHRSWPA
jgi:adenosylcobinamide hydrolase